MFLKPMSSRPLMRTGLFTAGRATGTASLPRWAWSWLVSEPRSLGACSQSNSTQSKPASPIISAPILLAMPLQKPTCLRLPASAALKGFSLRSRSAPMPLAPVPAAPSLTGWR